MESVSDKILIVGSFNAYSTGANSRTGENREKTAASIPHAHQLGSLGVCVPGECNAPRDTIYGMSRGRYKKKNDQQEFPQPAEAKRASTTTGTSREYARTCHRGCQGHAHGRVEEVLWLYRER